MLTYAQVMINEVERLIGRKLNRSENNTVTWLSGWDNETRDNMMKLVKAAYYEWDWEERVGTMLSCREDYPRK